MIKTKQIFQPVEESDGTRILITYDIDVQKGFIFDEHLSALGPSLDLLSAYKGWDKGKEPITWDEYTKRFLKEMTGRRPKRAIANLAQRSAAGEVITLLCYEQESNPHCHRHIVKKLICEVGSKKATQKQHWEEVGYDIEDCTCNDCPDKDSCRYAFDLYNTSGECLASK